MLSANYKPAGSFHLHPLKSVSFSEMEEQRLSPSREAAEEVDIYAMNEVILFQTANVHCSYQNKYGIFTIKAAKEKKRSQTNYR